MNRVFPHDIEAEESLIGSCLYSPTAVENTIGLLTPEDFFKPAHQHIWEAIGEAYAAGVVDVITVADVMRRKGTLDSSGGTDHLMALANAVPSVSNARRYAKIILAHRFNAKIIEVGSKISEKGWDGEDPNEALDHAQRLLSEIEMPEEVGEEDMDLDQFINSFDGDYDWLVEGFLERGDRMLLTAGEGAGKSTLLRQIAVSCASGIHPWNRREVPAVRVLVVDCENSARMTSRTFAQLRAIVGPKLKPGMLKIISKADGIDLTQRADRHWLIKRCIANQTDLLIIGPAYRLFNSQASKGDAGGEALAADVTRALNEVRKLGIALIMETHAGHGAGGFIRDLRPLGSSVWMRWPEFGIGLRRDGDSNGWEVTHWRGPRDGERVWPSMLERDAGRWPWTPTMANGTFQ